MKSHMCFGLRSLLRFHWPTPLALVSYPAAPSRPARCYSLLRTPTPTPHWPSWRGRLPVSRPAPVSARCPHSPSTRPVRPWWRTSVSSLRSHRLLCRSARALSVACTGCCPSMPTFFTTPRRCGSIPDWSSLCSQQSRSVSLIDRNYSTPSTLVFHLTWLGYHNVPHKYA